MSGAGDETFPDRGGGNVSIGEINAASIGWPVFGPCDPPAPFNALIEMLAETGQDDPFTVGHLVPVLVGPNSKEDRAFRSTFANLARVRVHMDDPPGKDIWQRMRYVPHQLKPGRFLLAGDCEDSALELIVWCMAAGVPRAAMELVVCDIVDQFTGDSIGGHAVVALNTTDGQIIGDFRLREGEGAVMPKSAPIFRGEVPGILGRYDWHSKQEVGSFDWVSLRNDPSLADVLKPVDLDWREELDRRLCRLEDAVFNPGFEKRG